MTKDQYMEAHHHISATQIGLARLHLSIGNVEKAEDALDVCSVKLKEIYKARCATMGIDLTQLGDQWK